MKTHCRASPLYPECALALRLTGTGFVQNNYGNSSNFSGSGPFIEKLVVGVAGGSSTFDGVIRNNSAGTAPAAATAGGGISLEKTGTGTQTLAGNNTYTGTTAINAGTLLVNGTHTGGNTYTVGVNGTLGGGGVITAAINVLGTVSPGNSIDLLTTGSETWNNVTTYQWEVSQAGIAGVDYDSIDVTGTLNFSSVTAGGITLELLASPPLGSIQMNDTFALWTYQSLVGWDAAVGAPSNRFTILDTGGFNGNPIIYADNLGGPGTIWLTHLVPEPSTYVLGLLGLLGLGLLARKQRVSCAATRQAGQATTP